MSTVTLDAVPRLKGTEPGVPAAPPRRRGTRRQLLREINWSLSRRTILQAGTVVGLAAIGAFPAARRALADGYEIYPRCPSYASDHDCSPGCGPSTIFADACETSGANVGWHKDDGVTWMLRPNACYAGSYDGWLWRHQGACGACACSIERRCHDGYRRTSSGWVRSICRWTTSCGCPRTIRWPVVRRGANGPTVYSIQHLLTHHGHTTNADGVFGPATEASVRAFEESLGLTLDGVVEAQTWVELVVTTRRGDQGHPTRALQRQLNRYGYALSVDGVFGPATEAATGDFQRQNRLSVDGVAGQATWRTLTGGGGVV